MKNQSELNNSIYLIFVISVLTSSLVLSSCLGSPTQNLQKIIMSKQMNSQYVPSGSLEIVGNDQLSNMASLLGWRGEGTISDPIVANNFTFIEDNFLYCLSLSECFLYIVFEKCFFIGTSDIFPSSLEYWRSDCNVSLVRIYNSSNISFKNCTFRDSWFSGLCIEESNLITITSSIFSDNFGYGIQVKSQTHNLSITRCKFNNNWGSGLYHAANSRGLVVKDNQFVKGGLCIYKYRADTQIEGNIVNGIPLLIYREVDNLKFDSSKKISQVILINCSNVSITDQVFDSVGIPIECQGCSNILILNCTFSNNYQDVRFTAWGHPNRDPNFNVSIINCTMTDFRYVSVRFGDVHQSIIINSIFNSSIGTHAITLGWAFYNLISGSRVMNSTYGIVFYPESFSNNITYCTIENCENYAVYLSVITGRNRIQYNNFINNGGSSSQACDDDYEEPDWRNNKFINNYWSDGIHSDENGDNYSDIPYYIDTQRQYVDLGNSDSHPLMSPSIYHYSTPFTSIEVPPSTDTDDLMFQSIMLFILVTVGLVSFLVGIISKYYKV